MSKTSLGFVNFHSTPPIFYSGDSYMGSHVLHVGDTTRLGRKLDDGFYVCYLNMLGGQCTTGSGRLPDDDLGSVLADIFHV